MRVPAVVAAVVFLIPAAGLLIAEEDPVMKEAQSTFAPIPSRRPP